MAVARQLTLPFDFIAPKMTTKISDRAKHFVLDHSELDLPLTNRYKMITEGENIIEFCFAQYVKAWHSTSNSRRAVMFYQNAMNAFVKKAGFGADTQTQYNAINNFGNQNYSHTPAYFRLEYKPRSKRIICDYAFSIYPRQVGRNSSINRTRHYFRQWIHVEYVYFTLEKRHIVDANKSWFTAAADYYGSGMYAASYREVSNYQNDMLLTFPWLHFSIYDVSGIGDWYIKAFNSIKKMLTDKFVVQEGVESWKNLICRAYIDPSPTFMSMTVHTRNMREMINVLLGDVNKKLYPVFYKFALELVPYFSQVGQQNAYGPSAINMCRDALRELLQIVEHYDDATFLTYVTPQVIYDLYMTSGSYGYRKNAISQIKFLLADGLFNKFPRAKQYRLLTDLYTVNSADQYGRPQYQDGIKARDLTNMLAKIHAQTEEDGLTITTEIPTRDVKTIDDYHDKVVPIFNRIKYKPVAVDHSIFKWLSDYGLKIPDTNLKFILPETNNTIREWGSNQGHCIGSYADNCVAGRTLLMGVWDEVQEKWIGHIQIDPVGKALKPKVQAGSQTATITLAIQPRKVYIRQFYGKHNSRVDTAVRNAVQKHMDDALAAFDNPKEKEETQTNG